MKSLIIVDVQNDFCPGGALPVPEGDRVVEVINRMQPKFDLVVATRDWHPADHGSFAANHPGQRPDEQIGLGTGQGRDHVPRGHGQVHPTPHAKKAAPGHRRCEDYRTYSQ